MTTVVEETAANRRAGCPPLLEPDALDIAIGISDEWPTGPPTSRPTHGSDGDHEADGLDGELDLDELTIARALRLLDAATDHLRTALELEGPSPEDPDRRERVERAIADVTSARMALADDAQGTA